MVQHTQPTDHDVRVSENLGRCSTIAILARHDRMAPPHLPTQMENLCAELLQLAEEHLALERTC